MNERGRQTKVYLEIVKKIKEIIDENQLKPGGKLPSERELAEQLKVGRSSVREALRALELLGLIETRRGEGTFIADFRNHRLVEILSGFILTNEHAKKDVSETKQLIELAAIHLLIDQKKTIVDSYDFNQKKDRSRCFQKMFEQTDNYLLLKIWRILANFESSLNVNYHVGKERYIRLIQAINEGNREEADDLYRSIFTSFDHR
ncbi:FadR/GntR family transcriptional regulator [Fervidibacillus halotolerans]|uniref:GntR family transcriptional regulator n=1 Tax=Fervidibacillus halotolerans TaxID=2980027 RepID=A0A9E8LXQ2_9BACI|nr:GntR family transcriptional regulator [Fervidibacillus halotolerans]WAA11668.1 GntR family transcriptional regulator [Fervidibacillus halotolerans]